MMGDLEKGAEKAFSMAFYNLNQRTCKVSFHQLFPFHRVTMLSLMASLDNKCQSVFFTLGESEKMQNYQIVQQEKVPDPAHESNSLTLQCSVIFDLNQNRCPEDLSVFWFKAKSDKSHPGVIYADGDGHDKCQMKSDFQKRCVFSKSIKMSDTGTYYCAVASCGEIFFGNETMQNQQAGIFFINYF